MYELLWKSLENYPSGDQKSVIHGNNWIILFRTRYLTTRTCKSPKTITTDRSFRNCCQGKPFRTWHCDVTTVDLQCRANARYWDRDIIFVDYSYTQKLAQRRSSLVNTNREYRFLTSRYSLLTVQEDNITNKAIFVYGNF